MKIKSTGIDSLAQAGIYLLAFIVITILIGCDFLTGASTPTPNPTLTHTPEPTATDTPAPTETPPPTAIPTITPTPTPDVEATLMAEIESTAVVIVFEIDDVLSEIGLNVFEGQLGWFNVEPIVIIEDGYNIMFTHDPGIGQSFSNFALKADVTWESTSGLAGCGVIFRSEDDLDNGEQLQFNTMRLSGYPAWDVEIWNYGEWQGTLTGEIKASSAIKLENGATNEYLLIVDGVTTSIYANGRRIGAVTTAKRQNGKIAFFTWQESGKTTCTFDNIWVWEFLQSPSGAD
ncbi:MAG: DUF1080 domain-containing protein [Anaerolineales bacterium]|nr:DUF1080 domain-containing protein [Anaerolineales bacterium]